MTSGRPPAPCAPGAGLRTSPPHAPAPAASVRCVPGPLRRRARWCRAFSNCRPFGIPSWRSASSVNGFHMALFLQWFLPSTVINSTEDIEETTQMTCKIERHVDGQQTTLRLIGYFRAEHLEAMQAQLENSGPRTVLDLDEVTLVDVEVVRFLGGCEAAGMTLRHCSPYIREWIAREQRQG